MEVQSNENAALLKLLKTKSRTKTELLKVSSTRRRARQAALERLVQDIFAVTFANSLRAIWLSDRLQYVWPPLRRATESPTIFATGRKDSGNRLVGIPYRLAMIGQWARLFTQLTTFRTMT